MSLDRLALVVVAALAGVATASAPTSRPVRLEGLDRLYFDHLAGQGEPVAGPEEVTSALPDFALWVEPRESDEAALDEPFVARDVELPAPEPGPRLWIRELVDFRYRISTTWWALYDGGRRSDVWSFRADPSRTDGKLLSNYSLLDASAPAPDRRVLRVEGNMFRPGGAWWWVGKTLDFRLDDGAIVFDHLRNDFGFFQGYEREGKTGALAVSVERELDSGFETRTIEEVSRAAADVCGFVDPVAEGTADLDWEGFEAIARCLVAAPEAKVERRAAGERSHSERSTSAASR